MKNSLYNFMIIKMRTTIKAPIESPQIRKIDVDAGSETGRINARKYPIIPTITKL